MEQTTELVKVVRKDGERFDCATWFHRAKELPKEGFKTEVERYLTGKEIEPWEIIYFKLYKSQILVAEQALEAVALMLGSGVALEENQSEILVLSLERLYKILPNERRINYSPG